MKKSRDYVNASALGSYFGCGFNTPYEQLQIDLGIVNPEFDEDAKRRMRAGRLFEDGMLDWWEEELGIVISDRNEGYTLALDDRLMTKVDGMTMLNGVPTVVEAKFSASKYKKFTDSFGYVLQCHAYMIAKGVRQCLLLGFQNGEPLMKLIHMDDEVVKDIELMVDFVHGVLIGLEDWVDFPADLLDKYSAENSLEIIEDVSETQENKFNELLTLKEKKKALDKEIKAIEDEIKENFDVGVFQNDVVKVNVSRGSRKGGIDETALELFFVKNGIRKSVDDFRKAPSEFTSLRVSKVKK